MKAKIDLEKFICSLMKRFYKIHNIDPLTTKCWLDKVLEDQGLEYRDGEIVEIPQESKDERIKKEILDLVSISGNGNQFEEIKDWIEKLGYKPQDKTALEAWKDMRLEVYQQASDNRHEPNYSDDTTKMFSLNNIDEIFEKVAEKQSEKPHGKTELEAIMEEKSPVESLGISPEKYEEIVNECIYGSDKEQTISNSENIGKNDTLLDLLNKMPSCITVDGIDYHFVMKKTIAYMAFYEGEGEGSGKVIFWMAGDPIELLTAMFNKLKEEGLLE